MDFSVEKMITVFTPTYNRRHTIHRTYDSLLRQTNRDFRWLIIDDGSVDGTRDWVESLGSKIASEGSVYDWMGRRLNGMDKNHFIIQSNTIEGGVPFEIEYVSKPNGGLYTGYNVAYDLIQTELCVCIDSDDYMPDDAIENIIKTWITNPQYASRLCGILGLDYNVVDGNPIGGEFLEAGKEMCQLVLNHQGDCKHVMRTELMKSVSPQLGFEGEKDFNPYYMLMQVCDKYPMLITNHNFCWVEYQTTGDSMSAGIWKQYIRSPRSYARYRIMQLQLSYGNNWKNKLRLCIHYVSSCVLSHDGNWLKNSPEKTLTILVAPLGLLLATYIRLKNR